MSYWSHRAPWLIPAGGRGVRYRAWAIALAMVATAPPAASQPTAFPVRLENYFSGAGALTADERRQLLAGLPITKLLSADASKEVAVLGAIWIAAPMRRYVEALTDIERFESGGGFKVTKRISVPPQLEDFSALRLPAEDLHALQTCRVGDCDIKLGERALQQFRSEVDWNAPTARDAANALMQRLALEYATGYLQGGNERLAVYRDASRPTFVEKELRTMVEGMPALATHMPDLRRYLLDYPRAEVPNTRSFLYWQETEFGLKPTIRISHLAIRETADDVVVASKMLYASHYFWTGLEIRALVPDPVRGTGFWFVTVSRARSDGLSGFTGTFIRSRVRSEVQKGALNALTRTRQRLEPPAA